ncbi:hypothetical protein SUGI_0246030 [Cryptomeria japonica]|uniref:uncharacterized protein LOC131047971 n=1 Tax=Cryptomeria japonica TaxID=3369 RepID=UPI002408963E|nr:uncharacterized protein LOC131047971 [Cryptomeria japonica]GLJ15053.1 hypothetical protein SUGI_0246030 [Cryptomeria japonica]
MFAFLILIGKRRINVWGFLLFPPEQLPKVDMRRMWRAVGGKLDVCRGIGRNNVLGKIDIFKCTVRNVSNAVESSEHQNKIVKLNPGMLLLKNWMEKEEQVDIVETCFRLGDGEGGFYRWKRNLWMMCLGKSWNPDSHCYEKIRSSYDYATPPPIPPNFVSLVDKAIRAAHSVEDEKVLPSMRPDVCIVNFYEECGRLGLHEDRDESPQSLKRGLPVVSFSVGDSAEFVYHAISRYRDENAQRIMLNSGDVLIFGGPSRRILHGISRLDLQTAPNWLFRRTGLAAGRLNLTFRQI